MKFFLAGLSLISSLSFVYAQTQPAFLNITSREADNSKVSELRLDPASALSKIAISTFAESVSYLPLQTTKESTFGEITQLEVTAKSYIIWDKISNSILFFDKKGNYITKIANTDKNVPIPFKKIDHFSVDEANNEILFNDAHSFLIYYYDLDGKFKRTAQKPPYLIAAYYNFKDRAIYYQSYNSDYFRNYHSSVGNLLVVDKQNNATAYLPFDTTVIKDYHSLYGMNRNLSNNQDGRLFITNSYDYNIYSIDAGGKLSTAYHLVMPAINTIPADFLSNANYNEKRMSYTELHDEVIYAISNFYSRDENILFTLLSYKGDILMYYNQKTQDLAKFISLSPDKLSYNLPFTSTRYIVADKGDRFITSVTASALFKARTALMVENKWSKDLPDPLVKFFKSNSQQNPVLVFITFKK
ncbi:MAG: 6-bladed beta-propeller [Bacteroidota bacterium]